MLQHFPKKYNKRIQEFLSGVCLYFLTTKPKLCKKVYFRAIKFGQERF